MDPQKLVKELSAFTPDFSIIWAFKRKEYAFHGLDDDPDEHSVFLEYNQFLIAYLDHLSPAIKNELFTYIENVLTSGDENLENAVATCFLESLIQKSPLYNPESFFPFLGKESREYCKSWDTFNNVKTKGLW